MSTTGVSLNPGNAVLLGSGIGSDIGSMSIEDALLLVQMDRVKLCESQLQDQISTIRDRNAQLTALNTLNGELLTLKGVFTSDAKDDATVAQQPGWVTDGGTHGNWELAVKISKEWAATGLDNSYTKKFFDGSIKQGEFEAAAQVIKSQVDNLTSSSQMDMVRLQSLNGKRTEAFDTMTNMLKKASDSKSSVVANFR